MFSHTTLPGITAHEVAPGHFSHGRALRHVTSEVRRTLQFSAFAEGWAHYGEELCVDEGFGADDPRIPVGVWLEALIRVTRLARRRRSLPRVRRSEGSDDRAHHRVRPVMPGTATPGRGWDSHDLLESAAESRLGSVAGFGGNGCNIDAAAA